jgi:hypothetical protein
MAFASGFTKFDILVIKIANLADGCKAALMDQPDFSGGHTDLCEITFFSQNLGGSTCSPN